MILLIRYFFPFLLIATSLPLSGITINDSSKSFSRFSIGVGMSLVSFMKYELPHYSNLNPNKPGCSTCEPKKKPLIWNPIISDIQYLQVGYKFNKLLHLNTSIMHIHEDLGGIMNVNYDTLRPNVIKRTKVGYVRNKYWGLSPSLKISIRNNKAETFYTTIEGGVNIDFIYSEHRLRAQEVIDSIIPATPTNPRYDVVLSNVYPDERPRNNKYNLNRISPFVNLYLEWFNENKTFSFSAGISYTFMPIYQLENTTVFYKRAKITPCTLGVSYHFK